MSKPKIRYIMDEAFIVVSVVSGLFTLAGISLLNHNWYKRENHKMGITFQKKKFDLEMKKFARELGLDSKNFSSSSRPSSPAISPNILDMAKGLSGDQIAGILDIVKGDTGGDYEQTGGVLPDGMEGLMDFAAKNPEIVKSFLGGLTKKTGENEAANLL